MICLRNIVLAGLWLIFAPALAQEDEQPCACCTEVHQAFDFWAGSWEVFGPDDQYFGSNDIVWMQDKCILQENWILGDGVYTGTSYNFYDANLKEWNQLWIDNQGGHLKLKGNLEGESMVLKSDVLPGADDQTVLNRITWTPDEMGNVKQVWDVSNDEGETWKTVFNGLYRPKSQE